MRKTTASNCQARGEELGTHELELRPIALNCLQHEAGATADLDEVACAREMRSQCPENQPIARAEPKASRLEPLEQLEEFRVVAGLLSIPRKRKVGGPARLRLTVAAEPAFRDLGVAAEARRQAAHVTAVLRAGGVRQRPRRIESPAVMTLPVGRGAVSGAEQILVPRCRLLGWDTKFWAQRIARVEETAVTRASLRAIDAWCTDNGVACVFLLVAADDRVSTLAAEEAGFFFTDVRMTFTATVADRPTVPPRRGLRLAKPGDRGRLAELARASHASTRFFHDPNFDDERCRDLYAEWMLSSIDGAADAVIVAEAGGTPIGYVTCELDGGEDSGRIGLIAVEPSSQGRGLGSALCEAALDWFASEGALSVEIVTQGGNVSAQRVFQASGARTVSTELWFHKWYEPVRDGSAGRD
jgi:dTDP-4-amino-4,6-dideoxy-D-galactose acyltransferase